MNAVLELSHVSKRFGNRVVIDDLSFSVPHHTVYGFIGENGSGKTTTMKMILGLCKADRGEIRVCGKKVKYGENKTNGYIGYLPDVPEFYSFMTPMEYLMFCGDITGIPAYENRKRAMEMLELTGLSGENRKIAGFSRGMKQRIGIAQALMNEPKLLICDEPTSALDPTGRKEILDILQSVKEKTTVLFSTHILSDVERICDQIGVLHQGSLKLCGSMDEIRNLHPGEGVEVDFVREEEAERFLIDYPGGKRTGKRQIVYEKGTEKEMERILTALSSAHICPKRVEMRELTLERLFMEVVGR
ncbi:ABC transporter ATP-binding protein [Sellimonas sp.]|uniref:ABC transporter ATP-binding protein n=1 Tax=Sellimonas sp. TaxID=2021466 RepID=UPI0025799331|nr:ABC transporter ATP-binding protein [Sellimonas sp.]